METNTQRRAPIGRAIRRFLMKRIVLAAITCLSLAVVALPAVSAAHSTSSHVGRDHRPDDRGDRDRHGDRHRDRDRRDRLEHFRAHAAGTAGTVQSFQNGVLTIKLADGSTAAGLVTSATRVSCEAMDQDFASHDGGPGPSGSGDGEHGNRGDNGDRGDRGDRGDENNQPACVAMLQQPGTTVRDAELHVSRSGAVWDEVELGQ
jgi:Ni/Co efflux regulator RcnB